jgi:hypothetical protein
MTEEEKRTKEAFDKIREQVRQDEERKRKEFETSRNLVAVWNGTDPDGQSAALLRSFGINPEEKK